MLNQNVNNWYALFTERNNVKTYTLNTGYETEFKTASLLIPQLVTRMWVTKQVGELPNIKISDKSVEETFKNNVNLNFIDPVSSLLGIGVVIVVPKVSLKGDLSFDVVNPYTQSCEFYEEDGELIFLKYKSKQNVLVSDSVECVNVDNIHKMHEGAYFMEKFYIKKNGMKIYIDGQDGTKPISKEKMLPFMKKLSINFDNEEEPIWVNAVEQIKDCNDIYTEMLDVMQRLAPIVAIPHELKDLSNRDSAQGKTNDVPFVLDKQSRLFSYIPGLTDTEMKYFGGGFDPTAYINALDFVLNNVSVHCGLGHKALSYDRSVGAVKTATEVSYTNNDQMINQSLINQTVGDVIKRLIEAYVYIETSKWGDNVEVIFEDAVFNTKQDYQNQLRNDMMDGHINKEFYLGEMYPDKTIDDIINNSNETT